MYSIKKLLWLSFIFVFLFGSGTSMAKAFPPGTIENLLISKKKHLAVYSEDKGGTLIFSDSPEYVYSDGILYSDVVSGKVRVLYYHVNEQKGLRKIAVMLKSEGKGADIVKVTRGGSAEPSCNYLLVGKNTQIEYFGEEKEEYTIVSTTKYKPLLKSMDKVVLKKGDLIYGVYDFETSEPVRVSILMYPADENPSKFIESAKVISRVQPLLRGTFLKMDRHIVGKARGVIPEEGASIIIGDDTTDAFKTGKDALCNDTVKNYGNYGINYNVTIPPFGKGRTSYYLVPLGGVYAGALKVEAGKFSEMILTPSEKVFCGEKYFTDFIYLGTYENENGVNFELSPPGASNLPVAIVILPEPFYLQK